MEVRNATGYLASRIVFYLMNLHTQRRTLYFARAGRSTNATYKSDEALSKEGLEYAKLLAERLMAFREEEHKREEEQGEKPRSLTVIPNSPFPISLIPHLSIIPRVNQRPNLKIPSFLFPAYILTTPQNRYGPPRACAQNKPHPSSPPQSGTSHAPN